MGAIEILYSGQREGQFQLYCISEVQDGKYIVFTLAVHNLLEPNVAPDRETATEWAQQFFYDAEGFEEALGEDP